MILENNCSWCHQSICPQSNEIIGSAGTLFCSENCFLFWRRASFKRAKTCDFCKNIRNAVSYVDFNDGSTQLQFCGFVLTFININGGNKRIQFFFLCLFSDKCLNQYKMQIFCRETQAHLELNPHLKDKSDSGGKMRFFLYDIKAIFGGASFFCVFIDKSARVGQIYFLELLTKMLRNFSNQKLFNNFVTNL